MKESVILLDSPICSYVTEFQVVTFKNNPFWWDIQDRDVASEISSVRAWSRSSLDMKAIEEIPEPIDIYLNIKNVKFEVLSGNVTMSQPSDSEDEKDAAIAVHTLEAPEEDSNGKLYVEFQNLTEDSELKVAFHNHLTYLLIIIKHEI